MCSSFSKTTYKYTLTSLFFQLYGIIFIIYFWGYKMGKSIYLSRAEFSKISGVSQQSLSNMFKRFTAGIETKYQFSEAGEIILNQIEYNRLVELLKEKEKSEIVNSVQEKKSDIIINNFSSEIQDLIKIFEKRDVQIAEILGENRYFKQHIEKQEEIITKQNNAINNLINLTKEQSSKLKELETRKITVNFGTEKIENIIDSKFNNNFLELEKKIEENKVLENKIYNFKKKVKKILMIFSIVILSLVYCYFVINDFLK